LQILVQKLLMSLGILLLLDNGTNRSRSFAMATLLAQLSWRFVVNYYTSNKIHIYTSLCVSIARVNYILSKLGGADRMILTKRPGTDDDVSDADAEDTILLKTASLIWNAKK
jgi:hypothetical protein